MSHTENPAVSVILTVFRRTEFLELAIQSVLSQTFLDWECIVSDDAETEASREICGRFASDPRVRYRRNSSTLGTPLNVAAALSECHGEYVVIFNDDDLLIEPLRANPEVVMAFGGRDTIDFNGKLLDDEMGQEGPPAPDANTASGIIDDPFGFSVRRGVMVVMGCMIRREAIDPSWLVSEVAGAYDYWLAINLGRCGGFWKIEEKVMAWRQHGDSVSATPTKNSYLAEIYIYEKLAEIKLGRELYHYVIQSLARALFLRGWGHLSYGWGHSDARGLFLRSMRIYWSWRTAGYWVMSHSPPGLWKTTHDLWRFIRSSDG
jgi:glycosyltransferase involved in cell wall biosynthesis